MIAQFAKITNEVPSYDVCIVGGGAAGLSMAAALIHSSLRVVILEAGGERQTKAAQALYEGELADPLVHPLLHHFRVRALGGSSRIWGGRCVPFDTIDFERREWVPNSGWPITREALLPFYHSAQDVVEAGSFDYDPSSALPRSQVEMVPGLDGNVFETRLERFSRPTNIWKRYKGILRPAANVHIWLEATVIGVRLRKSGRSVDHLDVIGSDGKVRELRARHFVLAAGGLETTRLLLASNDVLPDGIGNGSDHLGRHYMAHLAATAGTVKFSSAPHAIAFDYERDSAGVYCRRRLAVTEKAQREHRLLNTIFRTQLPDITDPAHGNAILSAMYLVKDIVLYEYSRKMRDRPVTLRQRIGHVQNVVSQPVRVGRFAANWITKRILAGRKLPSVVLGSAANTFQLEFHAEQEPNPESRLTLIVECDRLGMPKLRADWRVTTNDLESLTRTYEMLAAELKRTGTGTLAFDPDAVRDQARKEGAFGGHHLGTTRMSDAPADGVVDAECRVHGIGNLHIASGSVLPTSSQANPTLTIVALSLRLADRLAGLAR